MAKLLAFVSAWVAIVAGDCRIQGVGCSEGLCCSQWGFCGDGPDYCGNESSGTLQADFVKGALRIADWSMRSVLCSQDEEPCQKRPHNEPPSALQTAGFVHPLPNVGGMRVDPSTSPPGGLSGTTIPQIVMVTFDDAVRKTEFETYRHLFANHTNPNGCPTRGTFFVSTDYTDYHSVQKLFANGHEIAVHTVTHTTSDGTTASEWTEEITRARHFLSEYGVVPLPLLAGFRAPFLAYNDELFDTLYGLNFTYESTLVEAPRGDSPAERISERVFPYTLDLVRSAAAAPSSCVAGAGCPSHSYPGMWEVPLQASLIDDSVVDVMDVTDYEILKSNFDAVYSGTRAPFPMFLHPSVLYREGSLEDIHNLLSYFDEKDDVWVVTVTQALLWMKDRVDIQSALEYEPWECRTHPSATVEVCDGVDNDGNGLVDDGVVKSCCYSKACFSTCAPECPPEYPAIRT